MNMPSNSAGNVVVGSEIANHFDRVKIYVYV